MELSKRLYNCLSGNSRQKLILRYNCELDSTIAAESEPAKGLLNWGGGSEEGGATCSKTVCYHKATRGHMDGKSQAKGNLELFVLCLTICFRKKARKLLSV